MASQQQTMLSAQDHLLIAEKRQRALEYALCLDEAGTTTTADFDNELRGRLVAERIRTAANSLEPFPVEAKDLNTVLGNDDSFDEKALSKLQEAVVYYYEEVSQLPRVKEEPTTYNAYQIPGDFLLALIQMMQMFFLNSLHLTKPYLPWSLMNTTGTALFRENLEWQSFPSYLASVIIRTAYEKNEPIPSALVYSLPFVMLENMLIQAIESHNHHARNNTMSRYGDHGSFIMRALSTCRPALPTQKRLLIALLQSKRSEWLETVWLHNIFTHDAFLAAAKSPLLTNSVFAQEWLAKEFEQDRTYQPRRGLRSQWTDVNDDIYLECYTSSSSSSSSSSSDSSDSSSSSCTTSSLEGAVSDNYWLPNSQQTPHPQKAIASIKPSSSSGESGPAPRSYTHPSEQLLMTSRSSERTSCSPSCSGTTTESESSDCAQAPLPKQPHGRRHLPSSSVHEPSTVSRQNVPPTVTRKRRRLKQHNSRPSSQNPWLAYQQKNAVQRARRIRRKLKKEEKLIASARRILSRAATKQQRD